MSEIIKAIILGIIQGTTEFLPISSSGHLDLAKYFLNFLDGDNALFILELHIATTLSTLIFYRKDLFIIAKTSIQKTNEGVKSRKFLYLVIVSSIPVLILGLLVGDNIDKIFQENLLAESFGFLVTTILLVSSKIKQDSLRISNKINSKLAFIIGVAQAFAVVPSISRSAATICVALLLGVDRKEAVGFSFLMGLVPIIGGNLIYIFQGQITFEQLSSDNFIAGAIAAFIFGLISIPIVKKLSANNTLYYFAIYTGFLAILSFYLAII